MHGMGRREWDGDDPGIETAKERRDEVETGRVEQQRALPRRVVPLEQRRNTPGLAVQRGIGESLPFLFSVHEIGIGPVFGLPKGSPAKDFNKC